MTSTLLSAPRRKAATLLIAAAAITAPLATTPLGAPTDAYACTKAKIGGKTKCIAAGQYCARAKQSDYKRYGYSCSKKDRNGRWHLVAQ